MSAIEIISLVASIVAILTAIVGVWYQGRTLKQKDAELRHKIDLDWKEFREKYTSAETRMYDWLDDLGKPVKSQEDANVEIGFPYLAGAPVRRPELFYGRRDLLANVIRCASGKQMASMSFFGARKAGKTSFLHFVEYSLADPYPQIVPVYLDAQTPFESSENFYAYMLRETMQALEKRKQNVARYPDLPKEVPFEMLADFLEQASSKQWSFLMLLDEFESLVVKDSPFDEKFFSALRSLIQKGQVGWITASYRFVYMPETTTSPFANIIQDTDYIGALSLQDAQRLITEPAARFGHFYEKEDIDFIIRIAGRMPFMIQKAALLLYKAFINNLRGKEARSHVLNTFSVEMEHYFDSQMKYLEEGEYQTLLQIVGDASADCKPADLAVLEKYGFIEPVSGGYQILGQTFADYLYDRSKN